MQTQMAGAPAKAAGFVFRTNAHAFNFYEVFKITQDYCRPAPLNVPRVIPDVRSHFACRTFTLHLVSVYRVH